MATGIVKLSLSILFLNGVFGFMLEPSPTARFRIYTASVLNCSVDKYWTTVIIRTILNGKLDAIAFWTDENSSCKNNLPMHTLYLADCDYNERKFYLTIKNVSKTDDGLNFECEGLYNGGGQKANTTIDVQYPPSALPSITQSPKYPVIESQKLVFSCTIPGGNPLARISWRCDSFETITPTSAPPTSTVVSSVEKTVTSDDNDKKCTCVGHHPLWTNDKKADSTIIVYYRPIVTVSPAYSPYDIIENSTNFELTCTVTDANPNNSSFKWYVGSSIKSTIATYTIPRVSRSHKGSYACVATNTVGSSDPSSSVQINVLYGIDLNHINKSQPKEGTVLNITCRGESNPAITDNDVIWTKNDKFIKKGQHLVINNVSRTDSGTYVCSVGIKLTPTFGSSVNATGATSVEVDVLYTPTVTISPVGSIYELVENTTNIDLKCEVTDGNPVVKSYKWYKNGLEISTDDTYKIPKVFRSDTGNYTCDATNEAGTSDLSSAVLLNVLYGVEMLHINEQQPKEGTSLNLTCSGQSNPAMTDGDVVWTKQNNDVFEDKGRHLLISNVSRLNSGTYVCSVVIQLKPSLGDPVNLTGITTVKVDVLYRPTVIVTPGFNRSLVSENTTNLRLICNVKDANPAESSYRWTKDGFVISSVAETYTIQTVTRLHSGSYECNAINIVGTSDPSPVYQLNVLYGVSLLLSESDISVNESERWNLSCLGEGNPVPNITCAKKDNSSAVGEQKANVTSIYVDHANCIDTGLYTCSGNNAIGQPVSKSADIKVACKPRTYNNLDIQDIFINGTDESLNISTPFISFPSPKMSWFRKVSNGNLTELDSAFNSLVIPTLFPYEHLSILHKNRLEKNEFGVYLVKASNSHGSFLLTYNVVSKREPDPPTNITAKCKITSIRVTWVSRFHGGENQTFRINFVNNKSNKTTYKDGIADKGEDTTINVEKDSLTPDTLYTIYLEAYNVYGRTKSTEMANCTTNRKQAVNQSVSSSLVGGIAGSISALSVVVIVIGITFFWRRRQVNGGHNKLIKRHSKETDEDEEGLKMNPLYVTSGEVSNAEVGPVYGVVNKKGQKKETMPLDEDNDQGPVYSQVQKSTTQEKKKGKEKKMKKTSRNENYKDIELGTVYENSDKVSKLKTSDDLYSNAEEPRDGVNLAKGYIPKKNKDGLIYADLDLMPGPNGRKFVIRGIENKTNYAMVDLSIKVDPLPSDDDNEEDNDSDKATSAASKCNE